MKHTLLICRVAFALLAFLTIAPARSSAQSASKPTTVFLVRHAEKQATPPADPPLTAEGEARAKNLAKILSSAGIKAAFATQFVRTRETARPSAEGAGITPTVIPLEPDPMDRRKLSSQSIKNVVDAIYKNAGQAVLVVGHTNTLPLVITALTGEQIPEIPETDFDNLYIVTVFEKGKTAITRLKY